MKEVNEKKQYVNQKIKKGAYESKGAYKIAHKFTPSFRFSDFTYCFFINPLQKSNKKSILQTFIDFEKGRSISAQISNEGGLFFVKKMRRPSSVSRFTLNLVFVHRQQVDIDVRHSVKCVVKLEREMQVDIELDLHLACPSRMSTYIDLKRLGQVIVDLP